MVVKDFFILTHLIQQLCEVLYYPHFTDEETEAERGHVSFRGHTASVKSQDFTHSPRARTWSTPACPVSPHFS